MAFCPNCGGQISATMRFCPNCGQDQSVYTGTAAVTPIASSAFGAAVNRVAADGYHLALVNRGNCLMEPASDVLEDMFGYTDSQAKDLLRSAPVEIARNMTASQAQYIAQALTEYGMQVSVYTDNGYVDFQNQIGSSVFDAAGNYVAGLASALALFGAANRVTHTNPWRGFGAGGLFRPAFSRPVPPPPHHRRPFAGRPAPGPAPRPAPAPHPAPAPRPEPSRGPAGGRGPMGGPGGMGGPSGGSRGMGGVPSGGSRGGMGGAPSGGGRGGMGGPGGMGGGPSGGRGGMGGGPSGGGRGGMGGGPSGGGRGGMGGGPSGGGRGPAGGGRGPR